MAYPLSLRGTHCDVSEKCCATPDDSGNTHYSACYCDVDQGTGYTYRDEYGSCVFCDGLFEEGQVICAGEYNVLRVCPDVKRREV